MTTTYEIQVVHLDREPWLDALRRAVAAELESIGLHRTVAVAVSEARPVGSNPAVAVYLGSLDAATSPVIAAALDSAFAEGLVVIPVVEDLGRFHSDVPSSLAPYNGFAWINADSPTRLARILLEELGLEDAQRRVFISHKREDGLGVAEQVHDRLTHESFVPFIDRFAIRSGAAVQDTIADALEDHAFLLLLETPLAHSSPWVFDEVDYALSHAMGTLIVQWPDDPEPVPGSKGLPRLVVPPDHLVPDAHGYSVFTEAGLDAVIASVEEAHAYGLVRRRRMLVRSVEDAAAAVGYESTALTDWRVLVQAPEESTLVGITPRLPTAHDLQGLDEARSSIGSEPNALLVHSARRLRVERRNHLLWVAGSRQLKLLPEHAIGGEWS